MVSICIYIYTYIYIYKKLSEKDSIFKWWFFRVWRGMESWCLFFNLVFSPPQTSLCCLSRILKAMRSSLDFAKVIQSILWNPFPVLSAWGRLNLNKLPPVWFLDGLNNLSSLRSRWSACWKHSSRFFSLSPLALSQAFHSLPQLSDHPLWSLLLRPQHDMPFFFPSSRVLGAEGSAFCVAAAGRFRTGSGDGSAAAGRLRVKLLDAGRFATTEP